MLSGINRLLLDLKERTSKYQLEGVGLSHGLQCPGEVEKSSLVVTGPPPIQPY